MALNWPGPGNLLGPWPDPVEPKLRGVELLEAMKVYAIGSLRSDFATRRFLIVGMSAGLRKGPW